MRGSGAGFDGKWAGGIAGAVLKCPTTLPFIPTLAAAVRDGVIWDKGKPEPHELARLIIYLPTLAAVEPLKRAFLAQSPNGATFLPRIRVLGDCDPLDLFAIYGTRMESTDRALDLLKTALAVEPAFDDLQRQVHLAALIRQVSTSLKGGTAGLDEIFLSMPAASAFTIAGEIAALIGEAHAESADLSRIALLDGSLSSGREQLSLQLLRSVLRGWQAEKNKAGKIDREERRHRLMMMEAEFIRHSDTPVIIAGSTGSFAATVNMMEAALSRIGGAVVLYGLDGNVGSAWDSFDAHPEHPQHGLHHLLTRLGINRDDVRSLESSSKASGSCGGLANERERRALFLSEAMRPASSTAQWANFIRRLKEEGENPVPGLSLIEANTIQDEATAIALMLREALETKEQTAAFVTPSDSLLRRVSHALAEWGLNPTDESPSGDELAARIACCAASSKPEEFVELLRQAAHRNGGRLGRAAEIIDLGVLRQIWRPTLLGGIPAALSRAEHANSSGEARHPGMKRVEAVDWEAARAIAVQMIGALTPLASRSEKRLNLKDWLDAHNAVLSGFQALGFSGETSADPRSSTLGKLQDAVSQAFTLDLADYAAFFAKVAASYRASIHESGHPRLFLWKPLDARLQTASVVVLGGLNEGCWPQTLAPDPWLRPRDRAFAGLPPQERRVGQSAHDFVTLVASASRVILTRSKKVNGSQARPSRWISRIKALATGAGHLKALDSETPWLAISAMHKAPAKPYPIGRPYPRPPIGARPRRMSVTAIETWFANPYAIYARHILCLEPLRSANDTSDPRDKGILYHAALHRFFQAYPSVLPKNAAEELLRQLDEAAGELGFNLENAPFWRPRFARFARWFAETEAGRREGIEVLRSEVGGKLKIDAPKGPFEITARADRIDKFGDGSLRIYDFKTSASTATIAAARGAPQLALEGLLAKEGAFAGIEAGAAPELFYIVASGGEPPGEIVTPNMPSAEAIQAAYTGTIQRIARYDDEATAYAYETRAIFRDKSENDPYAHLARVREWAASNEDGESSDD